MTKNNILHQTKILILVSILILIGQKIGSNASIIEAIPGTILMIIICQLSLIIKDSFPKLKFPAFAWATLISLLLSMPFSPINEWFLGQTGKIGFLATTTPILAFAGLSVGNKISILAKLSWKIVIVAIFVFIGTFYGSAIISHIVLKIQGII